MSAEPTVRAVQEVGCLSAAKFVHRFADPIPRAIVAAFADCEIRSKEFSKLVGSAKDLASIRHPTFDADCVIGSRRAVVRFDGSAARLPLASIDAFDRRLGEAGDGRIVHAGSPEPRCDRCPAGIVKRCAGAEAASRRSIALV